MEIIVAKNAGYCFGVKRAIEIVEETLKRYKRHRVYTLGEIIHNPQVVDRLIKKGLRVVKDIESIEKRSIVIISAHGRSRADIERLKKRDCQIIDATCPYVRYPQGVIKKMSEEGYYIILLGDKEHPEVKGLVSFGIRSRLSVVDKDIDDLGFISEKKVALLAQTTQSEEDLKKIILLSTDRFKEVRIFNTICDATRIRQDETTELAKRVDVMVVVGGKNSANTRRLYEISSKYCGKVIFIETQKELNYHLLKNARIVGITAGASTPDDIIKEVRDKINRIVVTM